MLPEKIIIIAVIISFIGDFIYLRSMYLGHAKPNLVSWFIWMLAPFIGVFFQLKAGAELSVLPVFMAGFGPLLVIIYSLLKKNGYWKIVKLDIICGIISFSALILYIFTHNLGISILFAIISDGLAAIPTIIKSWRFSETESASIYLTGIFINIVGLLIIKDWIFPIYSFSIYLILMNLTISFCIYHNRIFKKVIFS
ncbi:hypothetical protein AUJ22_00330 [Candidatus Nomurabacteria bacterium CG1_02_31_12]|uniref:Uncharacterized protein n=1 Tax=Candidatus Nomurabacteria bacterium CG1_02_31_12 TaxID=1805280 RepID=A0A1J4V246_9BACT|nr:MAG: hypothetical protein AUJ22_00330 [Candidatus Nomurabacteria bacterium CG1_02_31_12]